MCVLVVAHPWFKLGGLCSSEEKQRVEDLCIWRCSTVAVKDLLPGEESGAENVIYRNTTVVMQWNYFQQVTETKCSSTSGGTDKL